MEILEKKNAPVQKSYPTWEILGLIIGFAGSAGLVPDLANLVLNLYDKPEQFSRLFKLVTIGTYLLVLIVLASRHLYKINLPHSESKEDDIKKFKRTYHRLQILNFIRQFPLSLINHFIFLRYKLSSYDLFKRHGEWPERPDFFNLIGRFRVPEKTIEIQYPRNFEALDVRETLPNSDSFGPTKSEKWATFPYKFLSITTWLGLAWTLNHIIISAKIFSKFRLALASLYLIGFALHALDVANLRLNFSEMDLIWKSWILFLLVFDLLASIGLFLKKGWGDVLFITVAACQLLTRPKVI